MASNGRVFVLGALKVRRHGEFARALRSVRERTGFEDEFRFTRISRTRAYHYLEALETIRDGDVYFAATIVDRQIFDPREGKPQWEAHAEVASMLLRGCINRRELVSVSMDEVSTPATVALEDVIARSVNRRLRSKSVITAAMLDSKSNDCLQVVDLLTSAVACDYRLRVADQDKVSTHKLQVVSRVKEVFGVSEFEGRTGRTNIIVLKGRGGGKNRSRTGTVVPIRRRRAS